MLYHMNALWCIEILVANLGMSFVGKLQISVGCYACFALISNSIVLIYSINIKQYFFDVKYYNANLGRCIVDIMQCRVGINH